MVTTFSLSSATSFGELAAMAPIYIYKKSNKKKTHGDWQSRKFLFEQKKKTFTSSATAAALMSNTTTE
jgi:hypothetical protein